MITNKEESREEEEKSNSNNSSSEHEEYSNSWGNVSSYEQSIDGIGAENRKSSVISKRNSFNIKRPN